MVPVQIAKASSVEEAVIIRLIRGQGTRREGLASELIVASPAVDLQLQDRLARSDASLCQGLAVIFRRACDVLFLPGPE